MQRGMGDAAKHKHPQSKSLLRAIGLERNPSNPNNTLSRTHCVLPAFQGMGWVRRGYKTMSDDLDNTFEGLYLLLSLDQFPSGYWGYSLPKDIQAAYTQERYQGSYTVSAYAAMGILEYSNARDHPSLKRFLDCVSRSYNPKTGAFGRLVRYTTSPEIVNSR